MSTEFKVGDRVRLTGDAWSGYSLSGEVVTIAGYDGDGDAYFLHGGCEFFPGLLGGFEVELVERNGAEVTTKPDAISPTYYQFPGGTEVRDISAHLTSFGGQALQYIARSTRLDGNNKGDPVENLRKAIAFLEWEVQRFEDLNGDGA